jgi:hypothetical protein
MRQVLNKSNPLELNTLFIQPTRWCALNCKGCLVKEHSGDEGDYHTPVDEQIKLFQYFYRAHEGCWANQITISIDDPPESPPYVSSLMFYTHMRFIFHGILNTIQDHHANSRPEVHMTFHTEETIKKYSGPSRDSVSIAKTLDVLSLSNIKDLDFVKELAKHTHINYNHLIPSNVTSININKYIDRMTRIGEVVQSIYLVMFKSPIGRERSDLQNIGDQMNMKASISYINTMLARLPEHVRRKITIDGCLQDTIQFHKRGTGCSANISRIQVWPDGSVSGCPYAYQGTTGRGERVEDILENIKQARKQYDFRRCHLPEVYNSIHR